MTPRLDPEEVPIAREEVRIARQLINYLLDEIRVTSETHCKEHGSPNLSTVPAMTLTMLSLGAADAVGRLTTDASVRKSTAIREFLYGVGDAAGDKRYRQLAGPLYGAYRNGIVHTFLPKVLTVAGRTVECGIVWLYDKEFRCECFDWLQQDAGKAWLSENRRQHHLAVKLSKDGTKSTLTLSPQILASDVHTYLGQLRSAIDARDAGFLSRLRERYPSWKDEANEFDQKAWMAESERDALFVPNTRKPAAD